MLYSLLIDLPPSSIASPITINLPDEILFFISMEDPWYGGVLLYLHTKKFRAHLSRKDHQCIWHQVGHYLLIGDVMYHRSVDTNLHHFLTHDEDKKVLNDCHRGAYGGHLPEDPLCRLFLAYHIFQLHPCSQTLLQSPSLWSKIKDSSCTITSCSHSQTLQRVSDWIHDL